MIDDHIYFGDMDTLIERVSEGSQPVTFLFGSGLTIPRQPGVHGVPNVAGIIDLVRHEYAGHPSQLERLEHAVQTAKNPYQAAFQHLIATRGQDAANRVIRRAVLCAYRATSDSPTPASEAECKKLELQSSAWWIQPGPEALGYLLTEFPGLFSSTVLTSNFDPLIEIAIRRPTAGVSTTALHGDGSLDQTDVHGFRVVHLHGDWFRSDTLHTPAQLGQPRRHLAASLARVLTEGTLLVLGYSGWDDIFTRSLVDVVRSGLAKFNVLWTFFESDVSQIRMRHQNLISLLDEGIGRGRVVFYKSIDVHRFLPGLLEGLRARVPVAAALRERFVKDFSHHMSSAQTTTLTSKVDASHVLEATSRVHYAHEVGGRYVSFYVPATAQTCAACLALLETVSRLLDEPGVEVLMGGPGEEMKKITGTIFTGQVYFYTERELTDQEIEIVKSRAHALGYTVTIRGPQYVIAPRKFVPFGEFEPPTRPGEVPSI